jgi:hypothetical protein
MSAALERKNSVTGTTTLSIIDPQNRTGKIQIPVSHIFETKGKAEAMKCHNKDYSLCLLFQNGKCNVGGKCHQIHADCDFVRKLREAAISCSTCCGLHGDAHSKEHAAAERTIVIVSQTNTHVPVPLKRFAATQGLSAILHSRHGGASATVQMQRLCRLHQQNRCKYGRDCRHMHVCREVYNAQLSSSPSTSPVPTAVATPPLRITAPAPIPLCPDLILADDCESTHSSAFSNESLTGTTTTKWAEGGALHTPETTTAILDAYLRGWTPASTCAAGLCRDPSPMFSDRSPVDLRTLCTEILGA